MGPEVIGAAAVGGVLLLLSGLIWGLVRMGRSQGRKEVQLEGLQGSRRMRREMHQILQEAPPEDDAALARSLHELRVTAAKRRAAALSDSER